MKSFFLYLLLSFGFPIGMTAQPAALPKLRSKTSPQIMKEFMDLRFGMFIHWGPVSLRGTEIGWSRGTQVPLSDYDSLYQEFNPVLFDANRWVKTAKDAGMKYLTITAKHHDGFCLWPTSFTRHNIMQSPYKKDIVGALAEACKKQGIRFCIYFSVLDWYDPDYPIHLPHNKYEDSNANMQHFVNSTMKGELKELITRYHPYMLWFDGNWESPWTEAYAVDIYNYIKSIDARVIINNRLGKGDHTILNDSSVGDFATPEQKIGALNMQDPWETCMTICHQWAWKPNDEMKSLQECIQTLAKTAGGNGNLLFNVGPMPDGRMEARQVKRLKQMGDWLKMYGASIYNTIGGPYAPNDSFATTRQGNIIYVHVFKPAIKELILSGLKEGSVMKAKFLGGPALAFTQNPDGDLLLSLPSILPNENDAVIELTLNRDAESLALIANE